MVGSLPPKPVAAAASGEPPPSPGFGVAAGPWRSCPVFITSTFRDMHAERYHLRDKVFPELEERLRKHRHYLEPVDRPMGVETASLAG